MGRIEMKAEESGEKSLDFLVVREDWSEYKLVRTGEHVKTKAAVTNIIDTGRKEGKKFEARLGFTNMFFKAPMPDDKGEPSADTKIADGDIIEDMQFEKIREPLNIYDVPEKLILIVKGELTELKKTAKFDASGNRIYHYGIACDVSVVEYPKAH
jgi:hypothetical protein